MPLTEWNMAAALKYAKEDGEEKDEAKGLAEGKRADAITSSIENKFTRPEPYKCPGHC